MARGDSPRTPGLSRREFVTLGVVGCACTLCPVASVLAKDAPPPAPVDVGPLASFGADGVNTSFADQHGFFVIRQGPRLYALVRRCTHKGGRLGWRDQDGGRLVCPRHGSRFDAQGNVVKGPAKRPLARLAIRVGTDRHVVVDPARRFEKAQWENPDAFLAVPTGG